MNNLYAIYRTDYAEDQLRNIVNYIADESGDVITALYYLDKIETAVLRLENFPYSGSLPRNRTLRKLGYRVLIVQHHLIFYKVSEADQIVIIYAIVDSRQDYARIVLGTPAVM